MKNLLQLLALLALLSTNTFFFSACTGNPSPSSAGRAADFTAPSPTKTSLLYTSPTFPAVSSTITNTPLPTIATFTPTFDPRGLSTATKASPAQCPDQNPDLMPWFPYCHDGGCSGGPYYSDIMSYLNLGGTYAKLAEKIPIEYADLTGDGVKEFAFRDRDAVFVLGCQEGRYEILLEKLAMGSTPFIEFIDDLNGNGIPELFLSYFGRYYIHALNIGEWDGAAFRSLIRIPRGGDEMDILVTSYWDYTVADVNGDGLQEIVVVDDIPARPDDMADGLPWRKETITLGWNGTHYVIDDRAFDAPQYRFQAVQDGDRAVLEGAFEQAIRFYEEAVFDDDLDWWSRERRDYESAVTFYDLVSGMGGSMGPTITPPPFGPEPVEDLSERPMLSAYAYFRLVALYAARGETDEAANQYAAMQQLFPAGNPGYPYRVMAGAFRTALNDGHDLTAACGAAIQYASEHPDILIPLGSDYHGWQSILYKPEDVCPHR